MSSTAARASCNRCRNRRPRPQRPFRPRRRPSRHRRPRAPRTQRRRRGGRRRRSWSYLAVENVKNRYRRTVFGPWWLTLQMVILIVGISIVFGHLLNADLRTFLPYVGLGYIVFMLLSGLTSSAAGVFIAGSSTLKSTRQPLRNLVF